MNKKKIYVIGTLCILVISTILGIIYFKKHHTDTCPYDDFIVVDVFDPLANYQGIQSGWFAKIVKDKFNMELNIIAPNVSGGGDTLYESRAASGNLGDLVIFSGENGNLQKMVSADLLLDMKKWLSNKEIMQYEYAINKLNNQIKEGSIYAIPSELSKQSPTTSTEALELTYGPYVRWDIYKELGYPKMSTLEDLLPVLKDMQKLMPTTETGNKTYAFSFFKNWDANLMNAAKQPTCFYGYDEAGFVLAKADGSDYQNILDENSMYIRVLKFYYEANQLGLVDPASRTQDYNEVFKKYQDGSIFFSFWPWIGQSAYNTLLNTTAGKGFMIAPIDDLSIYSYGCNPEGNQKSIIGIGKNAEDPKRLADFINWLYSPEGVRINGAKSSSGAAGPKGLTWEIKDNKPVLTKFGINAFFTDTAILPKNWGNASWSDGVSALNYTSVSLRDLDDNGYPYNYILWDSVMNMNDTALDIDWQEHMNASSTIDYLTKNNQIIVSPGCCYVTPQSSTEISTLRKQCQHVIVDYSWRLIFAENEETFNSLLSDMQTAAVSLGYDTVYNYDLKCAKEKTKAQNEAIVSFEENAPKE